jgi:hypothetical protein
MRFRHWIPQHSPACIDEWIAYQKHSVVDEFLNSPLLALWDSVLFTLDEGKKVDIRTLLDMKRDLIETLDPLQKRKKKKLREKAGS